MKIIAAMKKVKEQKEKIKDLQEKIGLHCANLSHETPVYGHEETRAKISEWLQACNALSLVNAELLTAIQRTNLATQVSVTLGDNTITKSIAEWVWRRREYAALDLLTWNKLTDRGLREGQLPSSTGTQPIQVKIIRHFDPVLRDNMMAMYRSEPHQIDAALEVVNATTDLLEASA